MKNITRFKALSKFAKVDKTFEPRRFEPSLHH